jgi:hypothetical protein
MANNQLNQSLLSMQTRMDNFCPQLSAKLTTSGTSASVVFSTVTGTIRTTFKITNKGDKGAYLAWGNGSATAVASSGTPAALCDYIAAGAILTQDFQLASGPVNAIAAIQGSDTQDNGPTILEITLGFGQ